MENTAMKEALRLELEIIRNAKVRKRSIAIQELFAKYPNNDPLGFPNRKIAYEIIKAKVTVIPPKKGGVL